jgi:16S rRNA C967 or C1407 C5-methylase (RsmB/RsmF family)
MSYESWRISFQSSEQAARAAYAEVEALRAEVAEAREFRDKLAKAIGNEQLRMFIEKHGEPVPLTLRVQAAEARAERLAEALRLAEEHINDTTPEWYNSGQRVLAAIRAALKQEEWK